MKTFKLNLKKTLSIMVIFAMVSMVPVLASSNPGPDTVTIQIAGSKMIFVINDKNDLESLRAYDMNQIVDQFESLLDSAGNEGGSLVIDETDKADHREVKEPTFIEIETGKGIKIGKDKGHKSRVSNEFHVDLGLNNYLVNGKSVSSEPYNLNNWGSRYVALSSMNTLYLGKNKGPFNIQFGAEIAWNNFMFEENVTIRKENGTTRIFSFVQETGDTRPLTSPDFLTQTVPAKKSKLGIATIGIPLLFGLDLGKNDDFRIAAGGYVNYNIKSWSKILYFENGDKERVKDRSDYGLNDFRYGAMATLSYKGFSIFGKYDMSPLFSVNPEVNGVATQDFNVYSFGVRL
jgi:hypothetical protein